MGLVHGDQHGLAPGKHLRKARHSHSLGRDEQEIQLAGQIRAARLPGLLPFQAGVDSGDPQPQFCQLGRLIVHKRNQRRDHQRRASARQRRQLIAQALARTSRHHQQHIPPCRGRFAHLLLVGAKATMPEDSMQQFGEGLSWRRGEHRLRLSSHNLRQTPMSDSGRLTSAMLP